MTYSFDLMFIDAPFFERPDALTSQLAKIHVKTCTQGGYKGYDDVTFVTPECVSIGELDEQVDRLHKELEKIREVGHRKFALAHQKNRERLAKKLPLN